MPVSVFSNSIALPDRNKSIEDAVVNGIGARPESETWIIQIFEPSTGVEYVVSIKGPNNFTWKRAFFGPEKETPEFIRKEVHQATH